MRQPKLAGHVFKRALMCMGATAWLMLSSVPTRAEDVIDDWKSVRLPDPPPLERIKLEPQTTALLVLDVGADICTEAKRPLCVKSLAAMKSMLVAARQHHMLVVYAYGPMALGALAIPAAPLAPLGDEPIVRAGPDKFYGSDLEVVLKEHHVKTVIITGTAAQGAVLYTASGAALRGFSVIVPVDCYSSSSADRFPELYTAWHLKNASVLIAPHVVITRSTLMEIG